MIARSISDLVGNTPLLSLERVCEAQGISAKIYAKLEGNNPAGSVKDRVAKAMIEDAEKRGLLQPGSVIIEPTSGNTGIGLAAIATSKGYRTILTMPDTMSIERRKLLAAYGAELVLTEGKQGMQGAIDKANQLAEEIPNSFIPGQFTNLANPAAHRASTGPEIWNACEGNLDFFVAGAGTGGTVTGVGSFLKEKNSAISVVAVEPADSPVLSGGQAGPHGLQGIGANFVPDILDRTLLDEIVTITTEEAFSAARLVAAHEGILIGISSGAALAAALRLAKRKENEGKILVVLFPDSGDRYLSTPLFGE